MKLVKKGLHKNHGDTIVFEKDGIEVSSGSGIVRINIFERDDSRKSEYFYTLEPTYRDIAKILDSLEIKDEKSGRLNESLKRVLSDKTKKLFQLLTLASDVLNPDSLK